MKLTKYQKHIGFTRWKGIYIPAVHKPKHVKYIDLTSVSNSYRYKTLFYAVIDKQRKLITIYNRNKAQVEQLKDNK